MTGSSLPARARAVTSTVYFSSAWRFSSAPGSSTFSPPRTSSIAFSIAARVARASLSALPTRTAVLERRQHEQLAGDELIAALLRQLVGDVEQPAQIVATPARRRHVPSTFGRPSTHLVEQRAQPVDVHARLDQQRPHAAALGVEHGQQQVRRLDELVVAPDGQRLRIGQRRLEPTGEFVHVA